MILDLKKFIEKEKPYWDELEELLTKFEKGSALIMEVEQVCRLHYLYERVSEDLVRLSSFSGEAEMRRYLGGLTARAYAEIHASSRNRLRVSPLNWVLNTFPLAFRRNLVAFWLSVAVTMVGVIFGWVMLMVDNEARMAIFPSGEGFQHLQMTPDERVAWEEKTAKDRGGAHAVFAAFLMQNNIGVSIKVLAAGMTFGIGTILMLFYNGVILGGVLGDFVMAGHSDFVFGWLLPHGVTEITAILIAGQGGLVIGGCLLKPGKGRIAAFKEKLPDLAALIIGVSLLLVWAGCVESFFSQYHEPTIPYWVKISFGMVQLILLVSYLGFCGRRARLVEAEAE